MSGWDLKSGELKNTHPSDDELWSAFASTFSELGGKHKTSYKFGLLKSILDNLFHAIPVSMFQTDSFYISYTRLFAKFAENYWNLVVKYHLSQIVKSTQSSQSSLEKILLDAVAAHPETIELEFDSLDSTTRDNIIKKVSTQCRKYVLGALYKDLNGEVYSFDLKEYDGIYIGAVAYEFLMKYKEEIEKLNYYSWALFLEKANDDSVLDRLLEKLDLATPTRNDLSVYRKVLETEFEEHNCFYCGKKLTGIVAVDHFIPWSFVKTDNLWNFVLVCPTCNSKKSNMLPKRYQVDRLTERNRAASAMPDEFVQKQFQSYDPVRFIRLWKYASLSGFKIWENEPELEGH